jgi:hypothetical protein
LPPPLPSPSAMPAPARRASAVPRPRVRALFDTALRLFTPSPHFDAFADAARRRRPFFMRPDMPSCRRHPACASLLIALHAGAARRARCQPALILARTAAAARPPDTCFSREALMPPFSSVLSATLVLPRLP